MRFVKPLDVELVLQLARDHDALVTVEENVVAGGAGSAVGEALAAAGVDDPAAACSGCRTRSSTTAIRRSCIAQSGLDREGHRRVDLAALRPARRPGVEQAGGGLSAPLAIIAP